MVPLTSTQVNAYLRILNLQSQPNPELASLDQLIVHHLKNIAFENIDVLIERSIPLDGDAVFEKVVKRKRGGYCFELNNLFARLLMALGYHVELLASRVRWGVPLEAPVTMKSHLCLKVHFEDGPYLVDVGFGSVTPWRAMPLSGMDLPDFPFRLRRQIEDSNDLQLESIKSNGDWFPVYHFNLKPQPWPDFTPMNWYTSTHPESLFRQVLMAARTEGDCRLTLANQTLNARYSNGRVETRKLKNAQEVVEAIQHDFHVHLIAQEIEDLKIKLESIFG